MRLCFLFILCSLWAVSGISASLPTFLFCEQIGSADREIQVGISHEGGQDVLRLVEFNHDSETGRLLSRETVERRGTCRATQTECFENPQFQTVRLSSTNGFRTASLSTTVGSPGGLSLEMTCFNGSEAGNISFVEPEI